MSLDYGVILGAPRSGTTFLVEFLDALPDAECVSGNLLPIVIPHVVNLPMSDTVMAALRGCFRKSLDDYLESGMYRNRAAAIRKWCAVRNGLGGLIEAAKGVRRPKSIMYKEPFLAFAPEYAFNAIPEAKVVYIYRDGRDVANSLVRSYDTLSDEKLKHLGTTESPIGRKQGDLYIPWWVQEGLEDQFLKCSPYVRSIWMWKEMVGRCHEYYQSSEVKSSGRLLSVKYEELMAEPLKHGTAVVEHLGGSVTPAIRKQLLSAHTKSVGTYKRRDPAEVELAERVACAELKLLGYV